MNKMVKFIKENGKLNQLNYQMAKKKVMMVEKPKDSETFEEFEKIITRTKKDSLVIVPSKHNILHFEETYENNSRNLQTNRCEF